MRWDLIPSWWSKPLKEMKLSTFNARAKTIAEKRFFRGYLFGWFDGSETK
jgi:putative SOS response-associated peptidase YedK